jgi:hypothetical protein
MPILLGFILGVVLTIAGAYEFDSSTGRAGNGLAPTATGARAPLVNWGVVSNEWNDLQTDLRDKAHDLENSFKKPTG